MPNRMNTHIYIYVLRLPRRLCFHGGLCVLCNISQKATNRYW